MEESVSSFQDDSYSWMMWENNVFKAMHKKSKQTETSSEVIDKEIRKK